jgi:uncharacterized protein
MPRKLLKRYLPDPYALRERRGLRYLGRLLEDPYLLHLNRRSVAGAVAIGAFVAFIPIPAQSLVAGVLAVVLRVNLVIAIVMVWITNPLTMPPIFYFCYRLGAWLLGRPLPGPAFEPRLAWFWERLEVIWAPFLLGSVLTGTVLAITGYFAVHLLWRMHIIRTLQQRRVRREASTKAPPG